MSFHSLQGFLLEVCLSTGYFKKLFNMATSTKKISMKDIAEELSISITTVSFVVNGKSQEKNISASTVKRVNDLIEKWGFNPNGTARLLRTGKSKTIGLIVEDIGNYFFANIAPVSVRISNT